MEIRKKVLSQLMFLIKEMRKESYLKYPILEHIYWLAGNASGVIAGGYFAGALTTDEFSRLTDMVAYIKNRCRERVDNR